jgi:hypothetical protein
VVTKTNLPYVTSADDFKFFNKDVPKVLHKYADNGFKIVIFRCDTFFCKFKTILLFAEWRLMFDKLQCSNQAGIGKSLDGKMSVKLRQRAENILAKVATIIPFEVSHI